MKMILRPFAVSNVILSTYIDTNATYKDLSTPFLHTDFF